MSLTENPLGQAHMHTDSSSSQLNPLGHGQAHMHTESSQPQPSNPLAHAHSGVHHPPLPQHEIGDGDKKEGEEGVGEVEVGGGGEGGGEGEGGEGEDEGSSVIDGTFSFGELHKFVLHWHASAFSGLSVKLWRYRCGVKAPDFRGCSLFKP